MESDEGLRDHYRTAERAAAAPYLEYPEDPWWTAPGFGVLGALFVLGLDLYGRDDVRDLWGSLAHLLVVAGAVSYIWWQRRRRQTMPSGNAPPEVNRVLVSFIVGAVIIAVGLFLLGDLAPLWLGLPVAFVVVTAAMYWYGTAYERAAAAARERLNG